MVNRGVDTHADKADNADDHAEDEHGGRAAADDVHRKTHADAGNQCGDNTEGVGENRCREFSKIGIPI